MVTAARPELVGSASPVLLMRAPVAPVAKAVMVVRATPTRSRVAPALSVVLVVRAVRAVRLAPAVPMAMAVWAVMAAWAVAVLTAPTSFQGIEADVRRVAGLLGRPQRGAAVVAEIEEAIQPAPLPAGAAVPLVAVIEPGLYTEGKGTLVDEAIMRAGISSSPSSSKKSDMMNLS